MHPSPSLRPFHLVPLLLSLLVSGSGCGLLFGNIKPVSEKSHEYEVADLHKLNADWTQLPPAEEKQAAKLEDASSVTASADTSGAESDTLDVSDISYQSEKTASIISLTSTCRPQIKSQAAAPGEAEAAEKNTQRLEEYMRQLLLGFSDIDKKDEKKVTVSGRPGLESTIEGTMSGRPMKIRAVVLPRRECIYDLMFIARPEHFASQQDTFSKFLDSFRLK